MKRCLLFVTCLGWLTVAGCMDHAKQSVALYERGDYAGASRAADQQLASHPDDDNLWNAKIRAALAQGDGPAIAAAYASYTQHRDEFDKELLRDLATATLGQALASPSVKLKLAAIEGIEELEIESLADQVHEQLGGDNDRVIAAAAMAVLHGPYPDAFQAGTQMLHSEDAEARRIALDGFAKKLGAPALADLEAALEDRDAKVRRTAARWLGQLKDVDAVAGLTARLTRDKDEDVRATAGLALAHLGVGNLQALGKRALADKSLAVRTAGVELLAASHLADADLVTLTDDADPLLALSAAIAVRTTHPELGAKVVARGIAAPEWTTRAGVANQLVQAVGKDAARGYAHQLLADADVHVRLAAARVLAHDGERDAAIAAFAAVDGDPQAAADLADLGDPRGVQRLSDLVRDPKRTADQRAEAADAHRLAHRVSPGLVAALADPNAVVRVAAAVAIGAIAK
jgi:HEAT repeat protein|nr:HEAT repeat domain-containing protein [Kofleriaceae bacterium]